ncbi:hypothetical protein FGB62_285g013 [Gracilaria domingensis]|nr:hypothetical protein FGB62_285g013 [Gracilaria domingensis]
MMTLGTVTILSIFSLAFADTLSRPATSTIPFPPPCATPSSRPLSGDLFLLSEPVLDAPFPSLEPLQDGLFASAESQLDIDLFPSGEPLFPAPSDDSLFDEHEQSTEPPSFQIITCVNPGGCNADGRPPLNCTNAQGEIRPDIDSAVLLLSEFDELLGSRITYRATIPANATSCGDPVFPIPWISTADDLELTVCVEEVIRVFFIIGNPFGTCCGACSFLTGAAARIIPPPLSCCRPC